MAQEIERKFLLAGDDWPRLNGQAIAQGYLSRDKHRTVRVRLKGEAAFLTIKGLSTGATRAEFEYPIPVADAQALLALCEGPVLKKTRYHLPQGTHTWEIDVFEGDNAGLVVAEIELGHEDEAFERPTWLGAEVTHDPRYFNANLIAHPYSRWADSGS